LNGTSLPCYDETCSAIVKNIGDAMYWLQEKDLSVINEAHTEIFSGFASKHILCW